jgi:serine/threonine protein kinase
VFSPRPLTPPPFPFLTAAFSLRSSEDSVEAEVAAELKELMNEVYVLGSLTHPNIMRFCAVCLDPPMIVTQYYQQGSLFDLLKRARRGERRAAAELAWSKRLDMLRDIAGGMVFLHSRRPTVVHGDLRSPNLLLDMAFDR